MIRPRDIHPILRRLVTLICFFLPVVLSSQEDNLGLPESIRCDGSIIEAGDLQSKVLAKCGEPTDRVDHKEFTVVHSRYLVDPRRRYLLDRFVMDFTDPALFAREQGIIGHYNHSHSHFIEPFDRDDTLLTFNDTGRSVRRVIMGSFPGGRSGYRVAWDCTVTREDQVSEWVYNLGPTRFVRVLTFRNGRLLRIEMMGYGY